MCKRFNRTNKISKGRPQPLVCSQVYIGRRRRKLELEMSLISEKYTQRVQSVRSVDDKETKRKKSTMMLAKKKLKIS